MARLKDHGSFDLGGVGKGVDHKKPVTAETADKSSFSAFVGGHEYLPIFQTTLNNNPNLEGNSANKSTDNSEAFRSKGYKVRPVVDLSK